MLWSTEGRWLVGIYSVKGLGFRVLIFRNTFFEGAYVEGSWEVFLPDGLRGPP